jgi:hypothetical protein
MKINIHDPNQITERFKDGFEGEFLADVRDDADRDFEDWASKPHADAYAMEVALGRGGTVRSVIPAPSLLSRLVRSRAARITATVTGIAVATAGVAVLAAPGIEREAHNAYLDQLLRPSLYRAVSELDTLDRGSPILGDGAHQIKQKKTGNILAIAEGVTLNGHDKIYMTTPDPDPKSVAPIFWIIDPADLSRLSPELADLIATDPHLPQAPNPVMPKGVSVADNFVGPAQ